MMGAIGGPGAGGIVPEEAAPGSYLSDQKDAKESSTEAQFGEVWKKIQGQYGLRPEKPREIKKTLGKDDFLRIMITQMKNQDPTSPFKAEQVAAQMAQFASVEQLQNLNQSMGKMTTQQNPLERLAMTNLIGKSVTIDKERFPHTEGTVSALTYSIPKDAGQVTIQIANDAGEVIAEEQLGPQKQGEHTFTWDGAKKNTLPAKSGNYVFKVTPVDSTGNEIKIQTQAQARVVGVSFEGQEPVFLVGDIRQPSRILMRNIVRIDEQGMGQSAAPTSVPSPVRGAAPGTAAAAPSAAPMPTSNNVFAFQKGEGSTAADPSRMSPEARAALARYAQAQEESGGAKGFPNGIESAGVSDRNPTTDGSR